MRALVTGATGLVGSHLTERLVNEGYQVKALVRSTSDTSFLRTLGIELLRGDLCDRSCLGHSTDGVDLVFHCAALVSDWAKKEDMLRINVGALRDLLDVCVGKPIKRFVLVSSLAVLGMKAQNHADESSSYVYTGDNYNYTKIEAEKLALQYCKEKNVPVVVIRPPYIYGARDRQLLTRVVGSLRSGVFRYIDHGKNPFSLVAVENIVDAMLLAAKSDKATGQIYHITDGCDITRREFIETVCDVMDIKKPKSSIPAPLASALIPVLEGVYRILPTSKPPILNRFRMKFMYTPLTFDIAKARHELGYNPTRSFRDSLKVALEWYRKNEAKKG